MELGEPSSEEEVRTKLVYYETLCSDLTDVITHAQTLIVKSGDPKMIVTFFEKYLAKISKYADYNDTSGLDLKKKFDLIRLQMDKIKKKTKDTDDGHRK